MLKIGLHATDNLDAESDDTFRFLKSLKELKELRSQIHKAADYCENSFLNCADKAAVLDNTKEYLCRAVVTVVDHLGCVTANLNHRIEKTDRFAETELRINCLKQKLDSCDQYHRNYTVTKLRWSTDLPRCYCRYILPPSISSDEEESLKQREAEQPTDALSTSKPEFKTVENMPLVMYTSSKKITLGTSPKSPLDIEAKDLTVMPVREAFSFAPKLTRNPSFHFQECRKPGGIRRFLKSMNEKEIMSLIRRTKRQPSRLLKLKS